MLSDQNLIFGILGPIIALLLSALNSTWIIFVGMRDRSKVNVKASPAIYDEEDGERQVRLTITNTGRRPISIIAIGLFSKRSGYRYFGENDVGYSFTEGDGIPLTLPESEWANYWVFINDIRPLADSKGNVYFFVEDATGIKHLSRMQRLNILEKADGAMDWHAFTSRYHPKRK